MLPCVSTLLTQESYDDGHSDVQRSTNYPDNVAKRLRLPASRSPLPADVETRSEAGTVEEEEKPQMSIRMTIALLLVVTVVCRWSITLTVLRSNCAD